MGISVIGAVTSSGGGGGNGFVLNVGSTGNTTFTFVAPQPAGNYTITSAQSDTTFDIYFVAADNTSAGYTNVLTASPTAEFTKIVVYSATTNDVLTFELKETVAPSTSGGIADGVAPFLTSASPTTLPSIDDTTTVTGGNFAADVEVVFVGADDVVRAAKTVVRSSSTQLIVTRPDDFPVAQQTYTMKATNAGITNPSIPVNHLADAFSAGSIPVWQTGSTLPTANGTGAYSTTLVATDADSTPITYAIVSGSFPGLTLNSATGVLSGNPTSAGAATVSATDSGGFSVNRAFTLAQVMASGGSITTVGNYTVHEFYNSGTFDLFGAKNVEYQIIAGGGGGGPGGNNGSSGGGGAGGMRSSITGEDTGGSGSLESALSLAAGAYTIYVGAAGAGGNSGAQGGNSGINGHAFTVGGGRGANTNGSWNAGSGGSGGGVATYNSNATGYGTSGEGFDGGSDSGSQSGTGGSSASVGFTGQSKNNGRLTDVKGTGTHTIASGGGGGNGNAAGARDENPGAGGGGGDGRDQLAVGGGAGKDGRVIVRYE